MGSFGPCVEIPGVLGEFGMHFSHFMDTIQQAAALFGDRRCRH